MTCLETPLVDDLWNSGAILAYLGAQDEFGPGMLASRVLHLRYLDATMALVNACTRTANPGSGDDV